MPNIVMEGTYGKPKTSTYKPKVVKPVSKPTSYYREEPYDNSGALAEAERRRLIAEAEARRQAQAIAEAQARAAEKARLQAQTDKRQESGYMSTFNNPYATPTPGNFWNQVKTSIVPNLGSALQIAGNAFVNPNYKVPTNSFQSYSPQSSFNQGGYREEAYPFGSINPKYGFPGMGEDWGMMQSGKFGSGMLDIGNWAGSKSNPYGGGNTLDPYWLSRGVYAPLGADPNAFDPYDPAGSPYVYAEDTAIPETYGGGGGYGGGGYSSSPGYYGQNSNYGAKWYENLLQWNI